VRAKGGASSQKKSEQGLKPSSASTKSKPKTGQDKKNQLSKPADDEQSKIPPKRKKKRDQSIRKPGKKDRFDPNAFGRLGSGEKVDASRVRDKRDIQYSEYKRGQERLEGYLSNPRIPASYKRRLENLYRRQLKNKNN